MLWLSRSGILEWNERFAEKDILIILLLEGAMAEA
jgi:hypothetical protein